MPSEDSSSPVARLGPVRIAPTAVGWRLLGLVLVVIGAGVAVPAVYSLSRTVMVVALALGGVLVLVGTYLVGVRV